MCTITANIHQIVTYANDFVCKCYVYVNYIFRIVKRE